MNMRKIFLIAIGFLTLSLNGQGNIHVQGQGGIFNSDNFDELTKGTYGGGLGQNPQFMDLISELRVKAARMGGEERVSLEDIEGSVYLDEDFVQGTVYYLDEPYDSFHLRYDAYNDEIEVKRGPYDTIQALHRNSAISCELKGERFVHTPYYDFRGQRREGYLILLFKGDRYKIFKKRAKIFKEGRRAKTSLETSFPHRFVDETDYFVSLESGPPRFLRLSKKHILGLLAEDRKVKSFIKQNDLDLQSEWGMIETFKFMDSL